MNATPAIANVLLIAVFCLFAGLLVLEKRRPYIRHAGDRLKASFSTNASAFIITPSLHRAHHSTLRSEHDSNYGIVLAVWDILFHTRKDLVPQSIGLEMIEAENFLQLFSLAFLTERRLARVMHLLPRKRR